MARTSIVVASMQVEIPRIGAQATYQHELVLEGAFKIAVFYQRTEEWGDWPCRLHVIPRLDGQKLELNFVNVWGHAIGPLNAKFKLLLGEERLS